MENYLQQLIDGQNKDLWEYLNSKFEIILEESPEDNYMTNVVGQKAIIRIDKLQVLPAPFTHELLHIQLKDKKLKIANDLFKKIAESPNLTKLFSVALQEHIGNCLEHIIMLPVFLELGYDNKDFIKDYGERKMNNRLLTKLQSAFKHKHIYSRDAIDFYIGKFFAMKSCNNKNFKYDKYYEQLKKLDSQLFALLDNFWEDLLTFDINDAGDSYDEILNFFINDITNWMRNKTIQ